MLIAQGDAIQHELDFSQFLSEAVYKFAVEICRRGQNNLVASLQNHSFFTSIKNYIDELKTENADEFKYFCFSENLVRSFTI